MNGQTIFFLTVSTISTITCLIFSAILLAALIRKRTMGTLLLWLTFLSTTIAETLLVLSFYLEAYVESTTITKTVAVISYTSYILFAFNIVMLYVFGNRLLLRDNVLVQLIHIVGFSFLLAAPVAMAYRGILVYEDASFYYQATLAESGLTMIMSIRSFIFLLVMLPLALSAILRITLKAIRIQKGSKDPIAQKGFQFIWQGTLLWYSGYSVMFGLLWFVDSASQNKVFAMTLFLSKLIISDLIGFLLLYLGWVMPDWLKRRLREKAWFTKVYTGQIEVSAPSGTAKSYIASEHEKQSKPTSIVEVSDR